MTLIYRRHQGVAAACFAITLQNHHSTVLRYSCWSLKFLSFLDSTIEVIQMIPFLLKLMSDSSNQANAGCPVKDFIFQIHCALAIDVIHTI